MDSSDKKMMPHKLHHLTPINYHHFRSGVSTRLVLGGTIFAPLAIRLLPEMLGKRLDQHFVG